MPAFHQRALCTPPARLPLRATSGSEPARTGPARDCRGPGLLLSPGRGSGPSVTASVAGARATALTICTSLQLTSGLATSQSSDQGDAPAVAGDRFSRERSSGLLAGHDRFRRDAIARRRPPRRFLFFSRRRAARYRNGDRVIVRGRGVARLLPREGDRTDSTPTTRRSAAIWSRLVGSPRVRRSVAMGIRSADGPQPPVPPFLAGADASHNGIVLRDTSDLAAELKAESPDVRSDNA
jgi:hypothetical protein